VPNDAPPAAYLSVCAVFRDEAPYLREWVAFHRIVGVERFFLYNNLSQDDHHAALAPYVEDGTVVVQDWPDWPSQMQTYDDCLKRYRDASHWIAFIDLDEFLFSPTGRPVPEVLAEFEQWPGVGVNWCVFGSSGHRTKPPGLVIENYTRRTGNADLNRHIKSIVKPPRVRAFCTPHFFMYMGEPGVAVDENHEPVGDPRPSMSKTESFSRLRINHYATKSDEEYRAKVARGRSDSGVPRRDLYTPEQLERQARRWSEVEDRAIQMYLPALRAELARVERRALGRA
jgi:Glycosyltransferase family 92